MNFEIEIKLRLPSDISKIRRTLRKLGFRITEARSHEFNTLFDNPKDALGKQGKLIRIRRVGRHALLTYKGPSKSVRYKKRHELEVHVSDADLLEKILKSIGYQPVFRYEKFRTEFSNASEPAGKVLLDETPVGNFLELEGTPRWIGRTARLLGFSQTDYITGSYGYLHMLYCREFGLKPKDMLFTGRRNA
ncbi:MAG TPA: class IV adenylate cyclase [Bryobacteraceae bacterium]|nr:class IV adenylate cyclase [Bryobacteraceae bacterium]